MSWAFVLSDSQEAVACLSKHSSANTTPAGHQAVVVEGGNALVVSKQEVRILSKHHLALSARY